MRSVNEYLRQAFEFDRLAAAAHPDLKQHYQNIALQYRLLANERERLIRAGAISSDERR